LLAARCSLLAARCSREMSKTFTNDFAVQANKTEGFKTTTTPAGPNG
jgi:NitT/TauT family transport system substrate-binding protein